VLVEGAELVLKHTGSYDFTGLLESWKSLSKPATENSELLSPKDLFEKHFRAAQVAAQNKQAAADNALIDINSNAGVSPLDVTDKPQTSSQSTTYRHVHEYFLTAVLSSLSYTLCHDNGYLALNSRTFVVPKHCYAENKRPALADEVDDDSIDDHIKLVTLSTDYTGGRVLVIRATMSKSTNFAHCSPPQYATNSIESIPPESILLLGPGGVMGRYKGIVNQNLKSRPMAEADDAHEGAEDHNPWNSFQRWKNHCLAWLEDKGLKMESLKNGPWLLVELYPTQLVIGAHVPKDTALELSEEEPAFFSWPAALCFRQTNTVSDDDGTFGTLSTYDPLEFTQSWFTTREDRDATILKRKKEREAADAAFKAQADSESQDVVSNMYSPLALRRSSLAGMVYPTPPDGIQHTVGATPSFDGNVSTPGQPSQLPLPDISSVAKLDAEVSEPMDMRNNQNSDLDFQDTSNGNLFGDMGDDLFGEGNDITDADFSFFDEPDVFQDKHDIDPIDEMNQDNAAETLGAIPFSAGDTFTADEKIEIPDVQMGNTENFLSQEIMPSGTAADSLAQNTPTNKTENKTGLTDQGSQRHKPSPLLRPEVVFRRLSSFDVFSSPLRRPEKQDVAAVFENPVGAFGGVDFNPSFSQLHEKYGANGRFIYPSQKASPSIMRTKLPTTDYFARQRQRKLATYDPVSQDLDLSKKGRAIDLGDGLVQAEIPLNLSYQTPSPSSDPGDSSDAMPDSPLSLTVNLKRKREIQDVGENIEEEDEMSTSFEELKVDKDEKAENKYLDSSDASTLDADPAGWSLATFLSWPESRANAPILTDTEFIAAAQILGDQAISRTFRIPGHESHGLHSTSLKTDVEMAYAPDFVQQDVLGAAKKLFKDVNSCTLSMFLEIQGMPRQLMGLNRLPPRPIQNPPGSQGSNPPKPSPAFMLHPPHLEVRRSDSKLSVLPSAIPFWDVLGLAPRGNGKHIASLCIYPDAGGMAENADAFLENIRSAYETRRLGNHERFDLDSLNNGLLSLELGGQTARFASDQGLSIIQDALFQVANILSSSTLDTTNFVVYFVYDPQNPDVLVPICSAFHSMFEIYKNALADKNVRNELVLQLVPLDFIAARTHLVVPTPTDYARLAMEVYDRCVDFQSGSALPSIAIEAPLPRTIDFKLTPSPSASLLQENSCLQIAYAQSIDDRWITAAWSDNVGNEQMTASYCLGRKEGPLTRQFSDIAHEIWETTLDIISSKKVHWRIMIAKCGVIEPQDVQFWRDLAGTETNAQISLTILTVDTQPSLQLLPAEISLPATTLMTQSAFYTTPVSTPQPSSLLSPEQSGAVSTPARDGGSSTPSDAVAELKIEPDAALIDLTDQTYGAVLSHRINNTNSPLEVRPTMISGYLIKRTGASASDVPVAMEVNIIWTEMNPRILENFLKEILGWYRGLATLARARGVVAPARDTRPWHVAAAEKAVRLLYLLM